MALKETILGLTLAKTLIEVWDRWKERKHERWKLRLKRELQNLTHERSELDGEISDIALLLKADADKTARENQTC